jgi:hypothetical protein
MTIIKLIKIFLESLLSRLYDALHDEKRRGDEQRRSPMVKPKSSAIVKAPRLAQLNREATIPV